MTPRTGRDRGKAPESLLKGFQKNTWIGASEDILELMGADSRAIQIRNDIAPNGVS